jgi:hypothetical protein
MKKCVKLVITKNLSQFIAEVQSEWSYTSTPIFGFMALIRKTEPFLCISGFVRPSHFELLLPVNVEHFNSIRRISSCLLEFTYSTYIRW